LDGTHFVHFLAVGRKCFMQEVIFPNSKRINGIRKRVYECAASSFGYSADPSKVTIEYANETDNLHCTVLFKEEPQIRRFRSDIYEFCKAHLITDYDMKLIREIVISNVRELLPLESALYDAQDNSSFNEIRVAPSEASSSHVTAVSLESNPLIALQMLEAKSFGLLTSIELIRCHLISKAECNNNEDYKDLEQNENNWLYMSWPLRQRFYGLDTGVPTFAIRFDKVLGVDQVNSNRTKVSVIMEFQPGDKKTSRELMPALAHQSYDTAANEFTFHFSVTDPVLFEMCLNHKHHTNVSVWNGGSKLNEQNTQRRKIRKM